MPGRTQGLGRDMYIQCSWGSSSYILFHTCSVFREALHTHGALNPYSKPKKWFIYPHLTEEGQRLREVKQLIWAGNWA